MTRTIRDARPGDRDDVAAFTRDTWPDQSMDDYLPRVFEDWAASEDPDDRTLVAEVEGRVVGLCHAAMCSPEEGWLEGIRVHPDHRGGGHSRALTEALFEWCRDRGATVARNLVFDWNEAGLGQSRALGFAPVTTGRWAHPDPSAGDLPAGVVEDTAAAWRYWTDSEARTHLRGLAVDDVQTWAFSELTRERLERLDGDQRVFALVDDGLRGMAVRTRTVEREADVSESDEGGTVETIAEYGVAAWDDLDAARTVLDAIRVDAAGLGADRTRVFVPATARSVSDAAAAGASLSDEGLVVMAADLTARA